MVEVRIAHLPEELQKVFSIRRAVFVTEQGVSEEIEYDHYDHDDADVIHLLALVEEEPAGAARIRSYHDEFLKVERMAVLKGYRHRGVGRALLNFCERYALQHRYRGMYLHAQRAVERFYRRNGFLPEGRTFLEAEIPHIAMRKTFPIEVLNALSDLDVSFRFSKQVIGDHDGLFMSNYEVTAEYLGRRLAGKGCQVVLEICSGIGATSIALARYLKQILALDINPVRQFFARLNAETYGVERRITFLTGDALNNRLYDCLQIDAVVVDVDWAPVGKQKNQHTTSISETQPPLDQLFQALPGQFRKKMVLRLSPVTALEQVRELLEGPEIEQIYIQRGDIPPKLAFYYVYSRALATEEGLTQRLFQL